MIRTCCSPAPQEGLGVLAGQSKSRNGDNSRPLWITRLSPPDSWWSLCQPGYPAPMRHTSPTPCPGEQSNARSGKFSITKMRTSRYHPTSFRPGREVQSGPWVGVSSCAGCGRPVRSVAAHECDHGEGALISNWHNSVWKRKGEKENQRAQGPLVRCAGVRWTLMGCGGWRLGVSVESEGESVDVACIVDEAAAEHLGSG